MGVFGAPAAPHWGQKSKTRVLRGSATTDLPPTEALAAIEQPALILSWESDPVHPVASAEYLAATMPHATLHVSGTIEDVRTWAERIEEFLGR